MPAVIIDGALLAKKRKEKIKKLSISAALAVIIVGENPASRIYVKNKRKDCEECGLTSLEFSLPEETSEQELLNLISELNERGDIDGILIQLPLPGHISEAKALRAVDPMKDVDAFHPYNAGLMLSGNPRFMPCTPAGILAMLDEYDIGVEGKHCVVVGRSNIVGKPMALLLLQRNATVTMCHSRTRDLKEITAQADILVSAAGKTGLISADMVKEGAVVIDVAMNKNEEGKLCGDVLFDEVREKASYISPVPGGVGPMTRVMLLENTIKAAGLR